MNLGFDRRVYVAEDALVASHVVAAGTLNVPGLVLLFDCCLAGVEDRPSHFVQKNLLSLFPSLWLGRLSVLSVIIKDGKNAAITEIVPNLSSIALVQELSFLHATF